MKTRRAVKNGNMKRRLLKREQQKRGPRTMSCGPGLLRILFTIQSQIKEGSDTPYAKKFIAVLPRHIPC